MIFKPVNIKDELAELSFNIQQLLSAEVNSDEQVLKHFPNIKGIAPGGSKATLSINKVYNEEQIKELCIKFRLRFLPSEYYKGTLPYEAVSAIKAFEKEFNPADAKYLIVAPAEFFQLKDHYADPLLFAQLGNGNYYLLHQWGKDFKPYSQVLFYPFRNEKALGKSAIAVAFVVTLLLFGANVLSADTYETPALWVFNYVCLFCVLSSFIFVGGLIYGLVSFKDLSRDTWNSKYFN